MGLEGTLFRGYVAQSNWVEERSVLFLLSFSLSVFRFSSLGGETANTRHLDDSLTKRRSLFRWLSARPLSVALGEEGKRRTVFRWLPSNKENGDISLYIGGSLRRHLSLSVQLRRIDRLYISLCMSWFWLIRLIWYVLIELINLIWFDLFDLLWFIYSSWVVVGEYWSKSFLLVFDQGSFCGRGLRSWWRFGWWWRLWWLGCYSWKV